MQLGTGDPMILANPSFQCIYIFHNQKFFAMCAPFSFFESEGRFRTFAIRLSGRDGSESFPPESLKHWGGMFPLQCTKIVINNKRQ